MQHKLLQLPLFAGVDGHEMQRLFEKIIFKTKSFEAGSLVVSQGEECSRLMILIEGIVKGEMTGADGSSLKIEDLQAPTVLAPAFVFGKRNQYPVNIVAYGEAKFVVIHRSELMKLFQLNTKVLQNFLSMISSRAQFLSEKLRFHSFHSLKAKLSFYLLDEAGDRTQFKLKHSQSELAELFGVARPSVGRVFMQLQSEGIIDVKYRHVQIHNSSKLFEAYSK